MTSGHAIDMWMEFRLCFELSSPEEDEGEAVRRKRRREEKMGVFGGGVARLGIDVELVMDHRHASHRIIGLGMSMSYCGMRGAYRTSQQTMPRLYIASCRLDV